MPATTKRTSRSASSTSRTSGTSARKTQTAARRSTARKTTSAARKTTGAARKTSGAARKTTGAARKSTTARRSTSAARKTTSAAQSGTTTDNIKVTIPVDEIAHAALDVATVPITIARRVLPAKGGLPVYAGIGALAIAEIIEWPIAVAAGVGYAVMRRWGPEPVRSVLSGGQPEKATAGARA